MRPAWIAVVCCCLLSAAAANPAASDAAHARISAPSWALPGVTDPRSTVGMDPAGRLVPLWSIAAPAPAPTPALAPASRPERDDADGMELRPDNPDGLMRERWNMMTSGDTTVTAQALIDAKYDLEQRAATLAKQGFGTLDAGLSTWEWMGPYNVGGRTLAILFDPANSNHIWAGGATGGISVTTDGGFSWSVIDDFLPSLSVTSLVLDPNTGFMYAGTGEFSESSTSTGGGFLGAGIFRSTDGGTTWAQLAKTAGMTEVTRLAVVPADGFIIAATGTGLFRSANSGISWENVLAVSNLRDVKVTPTSHIVLVGAANGALRSADSCKTWTPLTTNGPGLLPTTTPSSTQKGRCEFAIASDQLTCYVSIDRNGGEVWRSIDGGATWALRRTGDNYLRTQGWYDNVIWVDPTNLNTVVIGGIDTWRSTDGGLSFLPLSDWHQYPGASAHADHHFIVSPPNYDGASRRSVYFGNDGGIQRKDDVLAGPNDWTNLSNGLKSTQFYKGAVQNGTYQMLGGLQDNGVLLSNGSLNWGRQDGGDGGYCSFDAGSGTKYWEYIFLLMSKTGIFGNTPCSGGLTDAGNTCTAAFIAPFKADPVVPGRVFAGGSSLWRSMDYCDHWTSVRGLISSSPRPSCPGGVAGPLCSAIELTATDPQLVWVGYGDGTVSKSTDNGGSWTNVDAGTTPLPNRFVTDIAVNPSNTAEVYVTFGGFANSNVWFTSNGGTTWTVRAGVGSTALPSVPVETIAIHPTNSAWIYAGTSLGVLGSEDRGLTWGVTRRYPQSEGPAYTQVSDLLWDQDRRLIAFTYGRGVFRTGIIGGGATGPAFTNLNATLQGVNGGSTDWGDFDNDGDLDVVWTGNAMSPDSTTVSPITRVGRNDGGGNFAAQTFSLPGVTDGAARWGDYDRDGFLDLAITGLLANGLPTATLYRNVGGSSFTSVFAGLEPVSMSDQAWGDYDNDGDLDLLISGMTAATSTNTGSTYLYRNDGGNFTNVGAGFINVRHSSLAWGDYDNDGDLDVVVAGWIGSSNSATTLLYRNNGNGTFSNVTFGLPSLDESAQWGDFDADGDLDMLLLGGSGLSVQRNNGSGSFTTAATLPGLVDGHTAWGDYDGDGDLDIAASGKDGISNVTRLYRNDAGTFVDTGAHLNGARKSALAWGDYDNDGDLDLFLTGWANVANATQFYRNDASAANAPPSPPSGLSVTTAACGPAGTQVTFNWSAPSDDHTPANGLSYNLRVGTTPDGSDVVSPASNPTSGFRRVAALGNAQLRRSWALTLPTGVYYWGVQAIDGSYKGSLFSGGVATISATFSDAAVPLQQVNRTADWGDYDGDDDLDLLLTGSASSEIYRNDGGTYTPIGAGLPPVDYSAAAWGDFDNDGDLDVVLAGCSGVEYLTNIYRNNGGSFDDIGAGLVGVCGAALAWGDCDGDGDLDLLVSGDTRSGTITRVYRNDGGSFNDNGAGLAGANLGTAAWGDIDNDGDLDLLVTGLDETSTRHADLYRNSGYGDFTLVASGLPPVFLSAAAWADFDLDGDLDLLLAGSTGGSPDQISCVYRNDGTGALTDIVAGLPGVQEGSANWGDLNNDGRPDILLTGYNPPIGKIAKLLLGTPAGSFAAATTSGLPAIDESAADLGDFDNDGDLDVVLVGRTTASVARIYRSCGAQSNAPPSVVASLSAVRNNDRVTFSWSPANDDHSASGSGLSYNLRIGTTPGGNEITAAMSNGASGYRRLSQSGNAQGALSWTQALPDRRYYWSVQAIDPAYRGGPFAGESTIGIAMTQLASSFSGLYRSAVAWGDFDNDGDLDLLMAGTDGGGPRTSVYRNIGGSFLDIGAGLPGIEWCSVDWGDFDRDGDLDIALCGWNGGPLISRIYRNDGGVFTDLAAGLPGVLAGTVAWGDLDRDGDLDLLLAGDLDGTNRMARVYRNDAGTFVLQDNLAGVSYSSAEWGDYDGDGDLDLVVMGYNGSAGLTRLYRNINNRLIHDSAVSLPGAWEGSVSWGDYDRDGDPDLLLVGWTGVIRLCSVYNNAGGAFTDIGTGLPGISSSRAAWGDYDNDGDLDIATTGYEGSGGMSNVYRNDVGGFFDAGFNLPGLYYSAVAWGDYDNDGDLDLVLTGLGGSPPAAIYRNDGAPANLPPGVPVNPTSVRSGSQLTLSWSHANDDHTPFDGLSYNVRVGTTPGGSQIASAMSLASGWRSVARVGNARQRLSLTLTTPIVRTYWSVQAIDGAFKGSAFATEAAAVTDVETVRAPLVDALGPAAPSPLTDDSRIELALSQAGRVDLEVFDVAGHHVATLFRGRMEAGRSSVRWSARDGGRGSIAAGVYWLRMQTPRSNRTLKLVVMR